MPYPNPNRKPLCTAKSSQTGEPCGNWPVSGGTVCRFHGGRAGQVVAKIARNKAEAEVLKFLGTIDVVPIDNPVVELQQVAGRAKAFMGYVESRYLATEQPEYLQLAGRAMNELARQLEVLTKVMPAQPSQQQHQSDFDLDSQIEALVAGVRAGGHPVCGRCQEACSACASEVVAPLPTRKPLGLPAPVQDAEIVPEPVPEPSEPETAPQRPEKPPTHQRGCRCEPCEAAKAYEPYEPSLTAGLVQRREW